MNVLALLFALFFTLANGAPTGTRKEVNFMEGRMLSIELNQKARELYKEVEILNEVAVSEPPLRIRAEDKCDPESLKSNHEPCLSRVALALQNYSTIFGDSGVFHVEDTNCNKWRTNASDVAVVTRQLLELLKEPIPSKSMNVANWMIEDLCHDSVHRLYSFSIVTARVFNFLSSLHPLA